MNPKKQKMGPPRVKSPRKISKLAPDPEPIVSHEESVETQVVGLKAAEPTPEQPVEQPKPKIEVTPITKNNTTSFILRPIRRDSTAQTELPREEVTVPTKPEVIDNDTTVERTAPTPIQPAQPKSTVIKHSNRRVGPQPTKQSVDQPKPGDQLIDKPIVLDNETLNMLVNAIVDHMADKFVTKAELKSVVIDTLQSMVVPS